MGKRRVYCALLMMHICRDERNGLEEATTSVVCSVYSVCGVCVCVCVCVCEEGEREEGDIYSLVWLSVGVKNCPNSSC